MFKEPFLKFAYNLTWNPLENWVILIFSGQKLLPENLKNIALFFTFFKGYGCN